MRELWEETGLVIDAAALGGPVLTREVVHGYSDKIVDQLEVFFSARVPAFEVDTARHTAEEQLTVADIRWWPLDEIVRTHDDIWPRDLLAVLALARRPHEWSRGPVHGALAGVEGEGVSDAEASAPHTDTAAGADGDRQDAVPSEEGDASGTSPDETGGRE